MGNPMTPFFLPQTTSVIKSIQSGTITMTAPATTASATLSTEVIVSKSFCIHNGLQTGDVYAYSSATNSSGSDFTALRLSGSGSIQAIRQTTAVGNSLISPITYYTVVEYN
jgi:hypothetical protein